MKLSGVLLCGSLLLGCGKDSFSEGQSGAEGNPCFANGTCNAGLSCRSKTCVNLDPDSGAGGAGASGGATSSGGTASSGGAAASGGMTSSGGATASGGATSAGGASGSGGGTTCTDTQHDAKNCGACGHDCGDGECLLGVCQPALFARATTVVKIVLTATDVYFA